MTMPEPFYADDLVTIYHGDCRDVLPHLDPDDVDLVLTDPPYGIDLDTDYSKFRDKRIAHIGPEYADRVEGDDEPFDPRPLLRFGRCVLFGANHYSDLLPVGKWIIWDKVTRNGVSVRQADGETAWHNAGGKNLRVWRHMWIGGYRASERHTSFHPTQKPVALMRWLVEEFTEPGDLVLDPYMGSGPVAQACHDLDRRYVGVELVEDYCHVAVDRLRQTVLPLTVTQ